MQHFSHHLRGLPPLLEDPRYHPLSSSDSDLTMEGYPSDWAYHSLASGSHEFPTSIPGSTQEGDDPLFYPDDQHHSLDIHPSIHAVEDLLSLEVHHSISDSYEECPKGSMLFEVTSTSYGHVDTPPTDVVEAISKCFRVAHLQSHPRWFEDVLRSGTSSSSAPLSPSSSAPAPLTMSNPFIPVYSSCLVPTPTLGMNVAPSIPHHGPSSSRPSHGISFPQLKVSIPFPSQANVPSSNVVHAFPSRPMDPTNSSATIHVGPTPTYLQNQPIGPSFYIPPGYTSQP